MKLILFLSLFVTSLTAKAQEDDQTRTLQISIACTGGLADDSSVKTKSGREIALSKRQPSKRIEIKIGKDNTFHLFPPSYLPSDTDPVPVTSVKIPRSQSTGVILLIPQQKSKKYKAIFFNDQEFKFGTLTFLNTTTKVIAIKTDIGELIIKPGKKGKLEPNFADNKAFSGAKMAFKQKLSDDKWNVFYSSTWSVKPTQKEMMILYRHPKTKKISTMSILEFKQPESTVNR